MSIVLSIFSDPKIPILSDSNHWRLIILTSLCLFFLFSHESYSDMVHIFSFSSDPRKIEIGHCTGQSLEERSKKVRISSIVLCARLSRKLGFVSKNPIFSKRQRCIRPISMERRRHIFFSWIPGRVCQTILRLNYMIHLFGRLSTTCLLQWFLIFMRVSSEFSHIKNT